MSKNFNAELQAKVAEYKVKNKVSQNSLAKMLDLSPTALSQYSNSTYPGDVEVVEKKIAEFLSAQEARATQAEEAAHIGKKLDYVPTTISEDVKEAIRFAQLNRGMCLLHGDAGIGKTKGAINFTKENPHSTVYIKVSPVSANTTGVICLIAKKLGITNLRGRRQLMEQVCERLSGTNKVVIVDEAQFLTTQAIDALRVISDGDESIENSGNGIVLIGNSKILQKIKGNADAGYAQIFTRVQLQRRYSTTQVTQEDIESLFPALTKENDLDAIAYLLGVARSIHGIRMACGVFDLGVKSADISLKNLQKISVHMGVM